MTPLAARPILVPTLAALALLACSAFRASAGEPPTELEPVTVVAAKAEQSWSEVAGTVSLVDRERLRELLAEDLAGMVRYEPGVSVDADAERFGQQGFSIRGLDGNRVGVEVDGVPLPDGFAVGSFSRAGRDLIDPELLETVEILRGPASTLYGSDALAGVVVLRTRSAADLLEGEDARGYLRAGWSGASHARLLSLGAAVASRRYDALATIAARFGSEADTSPRPGGLPANPADTREHFGMARFGNRDVAGGELDLIAERSTARIRTDVRSLVAGPGQYASTSELLADDRSDRSRLSLRYEREAALLGDGQVSMHAFAQDSGFDQRTDQTRGPARGAPSPTRRLRSFEIDTRQRGLELLAEGMAELGGFGHWQVAGIELVRSTITELRDGIEVNLDTGAASNVIIGERFPVRDFPQSVVEELGVFWQDEITPAGSRWTLIPGLRWERVATDVRPDATWREDNPGTVLAERSDSRLTAKFGLRYRLAEGTSLFAQYAEGFRAPPFSDLNVGFDIPAFGYIAIPNPDLEPETSRGIELGLRHFSAERELSLALYRNDYRQLIESRASLGIDPDTGLLVFQSINRDRAVIRGAELGWIESLDRFGLDGWQAMAKLAWADGRDRVRDQPLASVAPDRLVLGLRRDSPGRRHGVEGVLQLVDRYEQVDLEGEPLFNAPGHALLDLYYRFRPSESVRLELALLNATDRRVWPWGRVRGVPADAHDLDLRTAPGASLSASLSVQW